MNGLKKTVQECKQKQYIIKHYNWQNVSPMITPIKRSTKNANCNMPTPLPKLKHSKYQKWKKIRCHLQIEFSESIVEHTNLAPPDTTERH